MTPLRQRMLEDLQIRRYSPTTIRIYLRAVAEFARHFGKPPDQLGAEHIRLYQLFLIKEKKVSLPTYIQMVCALRFFYTHTLNQKVAIDRIPFPRGDKKLPLILSREEVTELLESSRNLRHRALLATLYGCGLRRQSEFAAIEKMRLHLVGGKPANLFPEPGGRRAGRTPREQRLRRTHEPLARSVGQQRTSCKCTGRNSARRPGGIIRVPSGSTRGGASAVYCYYLGEHSSEPRSSGSGHKP